MNEEIRKEHKKLVDEFNYLKNKLNKYKNLDHRSECPCCDQKIDYKFYQLKIPDIESKLKFIDKRLNETIPLLINLDRKCGEENDRRRKEHGLKITKYIKENKNVLNKAIRDYNNGLETYLPLIPNGEKQIWNEAIEKHLDNRNIDENEELYFEI